ncbi:OmpA/MotB family protein [Candidatus Manganitrophus noduliformans]|uniref:OmpA family protein n=1 Tax=Candidatus Manganitrophus noduliformans TaxID=2606439 RepID=A0A7X6DTE7_9BACT|nr:OmpA family protein [Candidatus Manganitrophus noduliformans]NKE73062.1 OmpA family protein [Candidatus Manganitrophus noduliformans]
MGKRNKEEASGPDPNAWMVTFSDLLSLLLTFFVLLFAMKSLDKGKLREALSHFSVEGIAILESGVKMPLVKPNEIELDFPLAHRPLSPADFRRLLQIGEIDADVQVSADKRGLVLTLPGAVFNSGSSELKPKAKAVLDEMSEILYEIDAWIWVEGHTDDLPIFGARYPSNWDLSIGRAGEVVRYLLGRGLRPEQFSLTGYADTRPIRPNDTPENRTANRRVELILHH